MKTNRRLPSLISCLLTVALLALAGCTQMGKTSSPTKQTQATKTKSEASTSPVEAALFEDVSSKVGLTFQHDLGDKGRFYFVENMAPGCAFLDYNNDGYLDIFLVQSGSSEAASSVKQRPFCALYRNDRKGSFINVTSGSGLDKDLGYGQGVAVGDYDNDGYDDLFITAYGGNHLFRNRRGNGRFEDVTKTSALDKVHGTGYATSAAWGDYDNDGRLDLYVCYYARWTHALDKECRDANGQRDYCLPQLYEPVTHRLFHNEGKRFVDVSDRAGISKVKGRGLAVAFADFNEDGHQDIFVANDLTPNMLWRNNGNGTFSDVAEQAGCAYDGQGRTMAGMGIALADYDRSGHQSLYVSNFADLPNILFKNLGNGIFEDATQAANLGTSHLKFLSFGCEFLDYDADGWQDLILNNGHVQVSQSKREAGVGYAQRKQLLRNEGQGTFREITEEAQLGDLKTPIVGRGLAVGDYDNDGKIDVLAVGQNAPVQLFKNRVRDANHWISFKAIGTKSNRNGAHTRFEIEASGARQIASVRAGSSYLSSSDRRVYFGLGKAKKVERVVIRWPSGTREVIKNLASDKIYTVTEGRGVTSQ